jgi:RNA-directed DNA polymerase
VYNIQKQVVVAYRKGNLIELQKLQYKLIMSFAGRATAVRKVSSNNGRNTPGVDNIT